MAVERVKITPSLFRVNDASGNAKFSTDLRYIKTASPGSLFLATLSTAPAPRNSTANLENRAGHPFKITSIDVYSPINLAFFTAPVAGVVSIRPSIFVYGGRLALPFNYQELKTLGVIRVNGSDVATVKIANMLYVIPSGQGQDQFRPSGAAWIITGVDIALYSDASADAPRGIDVSVSAGDVVSLYCATAPFNSTTQAGYGTAQLYFRFYSSNTTLPLQVTI